MVQDHVENHGIGSGQLIFPVRLFAKREASGKPRLSQDELDALGVTDPLPNGRRYSHGTMGAYIRCRGCYVKILDEEDSTAADAIATILGDVA